MSNPGQVTNVNLPDNPVPAAADPYAPTAWGTGPQHKTFDFVTPGGQRVLLRKLDMEDILRLGLIDDLDFFGKMIGAGDDTKEMTAQEVVSAISDGQKFARLEDIINRVIIETTIKPKLWPAKSTPPSNQTVVQVDQISILERMAIFGQVFDGLGEGDVGEFREEQKDDLGDMVTVESPESASKPDDWFSQNL